MIGLLGTCLGGYLLYAIFRKIRQKKKIIHFLRESWGKSKKEAPDFEQITTYYALLRQQQKGTVFLSEQIWQDLNFDEIYALADRSSSSVGQQCLYALLRQPLKDHSILRKREALITYLTQNCAIREKIQLQLLRLREKGGHNLPHLFLEDPPERPYWQWCVPVLAVLFIAFFLLMIYHFLFLIPLIITLMIGFWVRFFYINQIYAYVSPITLLAKLLNVARELARLETPQLQENMVIIRQHVQKTRWLSYIISGFTLILTASDSLVKALVDYLNLFLLYDVNIYFMVLTFLGKQRTSIKKIFEEVGYLDAMIAIASFREQLPYYCQPDFGEASRQICFEGLYHPLLSNPVSNRLALDNKHAIITGSNMSGKTTFIRSVGINALFSQTFYTAFARDYQAPFFEVYSSINKRDNIIEGRSYYMAEVESLYEIVEAAQSESCCLFLLDELFKGTNAIERIAAGYAVLDFLDRGHHMVLIATHDVELNTLLEGKYQPYHFCEKIENGQLYFDYCIKKGVSSTRNAIALLELSGYPFPVISEAYRLAACLTREKKVLKE